MLRKRERGMCDNFTYLHFFNQEVIMYYHNIFSRIISLFKSNDTHNNLPDLLLLKLHDLHCFET